MFLILSISAFAAEDYRTFTATDGRMLKGSDEDTLTRDVASSNTLRKSSPRDVPEELLVQDKPAD